MRLYTDSEKMREASNDFSALIGDMRDAYANLSNLIDYLEPTWTGNAAKEYLTRMRRQLTEIDKIITALKTMQSTANSRAKEAEEVDRINASLVASCNNAITTLSGTVNSVFKSIRFF